MPTVSVSDVKDLTGTSLSDSIIQMQIDMVSSRAGDCLDSSYPEDEANFIALMAAAALTDMSDTSASVKSEKSANGSSTTYQDRSFNQASFANNQFGSQAKAFDINGCLSSLFPNIAGVRVSGSFCGFYR